MIEQYKTAAGLLVHYDEQQLPYADAIDPLIERLDAQRGALFASSFEYPGRYTCWDIGFVNPPLAIRARKVEVMLEAFNARGKLLLQMLTPLLQEQTDWRLVEQSEDAIALHIVPGKQSFSEEERSRQASVFSLLRRLLAFFKADEDYLGLYGAFGYDLIFQFEHLRQAKKREDNQRDMLLYLPDEIYVVNHRRETALLRRYDFLYQGLSTQGLSRSGDYAPWESQTKEGPDCDHAPGEYAALVEEAKQRFACGDLFEVVPSQTFYVPYQKKPSTLFQRMRAKNPAPYGFFMNLGEGEFLVGASPEMYVRSQGKRIESCPISGTVRRGGDAIEDAQNIAWLLASEKESSELTMCTDVDRNDKSRICEAGSVRVIGRRQIEMYSRLIHTVDHVEGILREPYDALDAFLTHMWVVTVTGAPKLWAMQFIEDHEKSPRRWYGGAVGWLGFNGDLNTGLVLRTVRLYEGLAEVRVGATLLFDSEPEAEERETRLKASAFIELLRDEESLEARQVSLTQPGQGKNVLLLDHQDSFVHTLANYIRQSGASVTTVRYDKLGDFIEQQNYDLVVLSPGPGQPSDFKLQDSLALLLKKAIPVFGVCLGLQGIVEYFGGKLATLSYPVHGKASPVTLDTQHPLFAGLQSPATFGRYHSLYADKANFPEALRVLAETEDGVVMAVAHRSLPVYAVQFHPETILSMHQQAGLQLIFNMMDILNE
ncbi:MAG: anthranilate synthase component I [Legionellaceae bacterium]|nr:anthranilate synthase component I [Legionellaceae bacterium]